MYVLLFDEYASSLLYHCSKKLSSQHRLFSPPSFQPINVPSSPALVWEGAGGPSRTPSPVTSIRQTWSLSHALRVGTSRKLCKCESLQEESTDRLLLHLGHYITPISFKLIDSACFQGGLRVWAHPVHRHVHGEAHAVVLLQGQEHGGWSHLPLHHNQPDEEELPVLCGYEATLLLWEGGQGGRCGMATHRLQHQILSQLRSGQWTVFSQYTSRLQAFSKLMQRLMCLWKAHISPGARITEADHNRRTLRHRLYSHRSSNSLENQCLFLSVQDSDEIDINTIALYSLTWTLQFPHDSDTCYLAHCYPYTYSHLQRYLQRVSSNPAVASYCKLRVLCHSLAGNAVYVMNITSPGGWKGEGQDQEGRGGDGPGAPRGNQQLLDDGGVAGLSARGLVWCSDAQGHFCF